MTKKHRGFKSKKSPAWHEDLVVEVLGPALKKDLGAAWRVMMALEAAGYTIVRPKKIHSACRWCGTKDRQTRVDKELRERKVRCFKCYVRSRGADDEGRLAARWRKLPITELKYAPR